MNLTALEQALMPIAAPLLQSLWIGTILPAIQKELKSGSPEIQLVETQLVAMLNNVVPPLITDLGKL